MEIETEINLETKNNLSLLNQINLVSKKMVHLEFLMCTDKNFRYIYERNFERYYKIRKAIINKLYFKQCENYLFENKLEL